MNTDDELPNIDKILKNDDEDFVPGGGSNLAAIFGYRSKDEDIPNLIKPAGQKKPSNKHDSSQIQSSVKTEVIMAKEIQAYKLQNGLYTSIGKLGIALTGNVSTRVYQIILYKSKHEYVSVVTITREFTYTVQGNNFSTYYDNSNKNWSILFESNDACIEFAREIGVARYFSKKERIEDVIYQDLTVATNDKVAKEGSNVSIKYFISTDITLPCKISSMSFQTMTVNISMDENWEKTLLGSSKGLRRILILPCSKQISLGPGFPKDKDIMMEIEVINIQESEDTYSLSKPVVTGKASLLSRMAKMGQSILPKMPSTTDSEDTEDDSLQKSPRHKKSEPLGVSLQKKHVPQEISDNTIQSTYKVVESKNDVPSTNPNVSKPLIPTSALSPAWPSTQLQPNYMALNSQMYSLQPQPINQGVPTVMDPNLNMLLSETRMANAELRMGMSKITDNVQKVLDKLHTLELQKASSTKDTSMEDTLKLLLTMNMTQSGVRDMELLKKTNASKDVCCEHLSELSRAEKELTDLGNEVKCVKDSLTKSIESVKSLEEEKISLLCVNKELRDKIQDLQVSLNNANDELSTKLADLEACKLSQSKYEKEITELKDKISKITTECAVIGTNVASSKQQEKENKNKEIKYIMNRTYLTLMETFTNESYDSDYIKSVIANTIKNITLQVLQESAEKDENAQSNNEQSDKCLSSPSSSKEYGVIPVLQNEPPPIPPMDKELSDNI